MRTAGFIKILFNRPKKQSDYNPIPTWGRNRGIVRLLLLYFLFTNIASLSLTSHLRSVPSYSQRIISPLLNKPTLDRDQLSNYRPITNLSHILDSRTCEISTYCSPCLQWSSQSQPVCHCKHHSIETALLYIHDYLINAIESQKLSCLFASSIFLPLSLLKKTSTKTRLSSWFEIHGHVLNWFKFYLSSCSLSVLSDTYQWIDEDGKTLCPLKKQERPADADKPARRESMPKIAPVRRENMLQTS